MALFVGRLTRDKGLRDLCQLANTLDDLHVLVIVGAPEPVDDCDERAISTLQSHPNVRVHTHTDHIEQYYAAADVLVLPTKREGLPTVVLEAAACGVPTVSYMATGVIDVIVNNESGIIVPMGDMHGLIAATHRLLDNKEMRTALGHEARKDVVRRFSQTMVWENWRTYLSRPPERLRTSR